jgi:tRNA threonylcarbamoyladenosine biosynthesis protein TsaB
MLLAIDTSTKQAGVALYDGERGLLAESNWLSANRHTEELMPTVAQMLDRAGVSARQLTAVGVAIGPGSFTGLRVGLAAAKGLALAHGVKLVGISALDFTAYPHQSQPAPVVAVVQAGRGRVCWAPYAHGPSGWGSQEPFQLTTVIALANHVTRPMVFVGEISASDRETLTKFAGKPRAIFLPPSLSVRRAGHLAEMAWKRFAAGDVDDPAALSPFYMQQPDGAPAQQEPPVMKPAPRS